MPQILATKIEGQLARSEAVEYYRIDSFEERSDFPLRPRDARTDGIFIQRVDLLVAPVIRFDPENPYKLNEFMMNLTDAKPSSTQEFKTQRVTGTDTSRDLILGRLTFNEAIGRKKVTLTTEINTDQPQTFAKAGIALESKEMSEIDLLRQIVMRPYPDVRAIRVMAQIEQELADGKDLPINYEFIWLLNMIRAPFITSLKRGRNPFTRSRLLKADSE